MEDEKKSMRKLIQEGFSEVQFVPKEEEDLVNFYREK